MIAFAGYDCRLRNTPDCFCSLKHLTYSFLQNVPPAVLIRFLREHRSEWADSNIDAYSAAAGKAGPCGFPGSRIGGYGGQVILPLAHTIEHEEVVFFCLSFFFERLRDATIFLLQIMVTGLMGVCLFYGHLKLLCLYFSYI